MRASLGDWDLYPELKYLDVPVLIVVGTESIFPEEGVTKLHQTLAHSVIAPLSGVSHFPPIESSEAFHRAVAGFIQRLPEETTSLS